MFFAINTLAVKKTSSHELDYETVRRATPPQLDLDGCSGPQCDLVASEEIVKSNSIANAIASQGGASIIDDGPGQAKRVILRGLDDRSLGLYVDGFQLRSPGRGGLDLSLLDTLPVNNLKINGAAGHSLWGPSGSIDVSLFDRDNLSRKQTTAKKRMTKITLAQAPWRQRRISLQFNSSSGYRKFLSHVSYRQGRNNFRFSDDLNRSLSRINNDNIQLGWSSKFATRLPPSMRFELLHYVSAYWRGAPGPNQRQNPNARQSDIFAFAGVKIAKKKVFRKRDSIAMLLSQRVGQFSFRDHPKTTVLNRPRVNSIGIYQHLDAVLKYETTEKNLTFSTDLVLPAAIFVSSGTGQIARLDPRGTVGMSLFDESNTFVFSAQTGVFSSTAFRRQWVGATTMRYSPIAGNTEVSIEAGWGKSVRYPSFQEQFLRIDGFGGNATLSPEIANRADLSLLIEQHAAEKHKLSLDSTAYVSLLSNTILTAPVSSFLIRPDNYENTTMMGIESSIGYTWSSYLHFSLGYEYLNTAFGNTALQLPGRPSHRFRFSFERPTSEKTNNTIVEMLQTISPWIRINAQSSFFVDRFNSIEEEGRAMLSCGIHAHLHTLNFDLSANNVLNKKNAIDRVGFPLAPFSILAKISVQLGNN